MRSRVFLRLLICIVFWVLLYGDLRYLFAAQRELVSQAINGFTVFSIGLATLAVIVTVPVVRHKKARS